MPFFLGALWSESWLLLLLLGLLTGPSWEPVELWGQETTFGEVLSSQLELGRSTFQCPFSNFSTSTRLFHDIHLTRHYA